MGLDTKSGLIHYSSNTAVYRYKLTKAQEGGNKVANTSWGQAGAGLTPNAGTNKAVNKWERFPFTEETVSATWSTATLQLTSGNGANCSSFLLDAGTYYARCVCTQYNAGSPAITISTDTASTKATALSGVLLEGMGTYGGFSTNPGTHESTIDGIFVLGSQTRIYVHQNLTVVNATYACGFAQNRVGRDEIHGELFLEKLQ